MKAAIFLVFVLTLATVACNNNATTTSPSSTTTTTTTPASPTITETFSDTLPVGGAKFYSFSISIYGTVNATLVSIGGNGVPPTVMVDLGIGTLSGTTCSSSSPTAVQVGATAQVTATEQPGTYCVNVSDVGNLFGPAPFTVSIDHP